MEVTDEGGVEDETPRNPAPFLRPITLPIHEVLMPPAPTTNVQQPPDGVSRVVVNQTGRRGGAAVGQRGLVETGFTRDR